MTDRERDRLDAIMLTVFGAAVMLVVVAALVKLVWS